jgi:pyruvate,water dikinase
MVRRIAKGGKRMSSFVLAFQDIDKTKLMVVGGKGVNLGELSKIEGIRVPDGFCISIDAFKRIMGETPALNELLDRLSLLKVEDRDKIGELSGEIRRVIEGIAIPQDINEEITRFLSRFGEKNAYALRSSATAEDLPAASFAGQHDTYLNIIGKESILKHISKCWASLFTERAVIYRLQNGFDHRKVHLSVVVQKMVFPQAAGILFTADPVTSNRKVLSIDAGFGLGEAMVSGLVNPDIYKVCNGKVIDKKISTKKMAVYALKDGGTKEQEIEPERQNRQALTDEQILRLERMGRKIEEHFGRPQDIEWCISWGHSSDPQSPAPERGVSPDRCRYSSGLEDGQLDEVCPLTFFVVQSRPITTLYPIPEANDQENHVYVSVGHQQMMTDPMKPLGMSFFLLTTPAPMRKAGGRLFVDVTRHLASPVRREILLDTQGPFLGQHDPLIRDALINIIERDFIKSLPDDKKEPSSGKSNKVIPSSGSQIQIEIDPAIVSDLIKRSQTSMEEIKQNIQTKSGSDLFDFILDDLQQLKKIIFDPQNMGVIITTMNASSWFICAYD